MQFNNQNKLISYFFIVLSIFIILFLTKDSYFKLKENMDNLSEKNNEYTEQQELLKKLNLIKENKELSKTVKPYIHEMKENEILDHFYWQVKNNSFWSGYVVLNWINLEKWSKNEYWFNEGKINLSLIVSDNHELYKMLNFITWPSLKYKFFMDNFNFSYNKDSKSWYQVNIPIKVFYK